MRVARGAPGVQCLSGCPGRRQAGEKGLVRLAGGGGGEFFVSELHTHVVIIVPNRWDLLSFSSFL